MSRPAPPYTLAATSCGRRDLLARTLGSLLLPLDRAAEAVVARVAPGARVLLNPGRLGQMASLDQLDGEIDTPLAFHCEDDWEFTRDGFIAESWALLAAFPEISLVTLRPRAEPNPPVRDAPERALGELRWFRADPVAHPEYFCHSFNPGLRRTDDARRFPPFSALGAEEDESWAFNKAGFAKAYVAEPAVRHIGEARHLDDPTRPRRARGLAARLLRPARKRAKRIARAFGAGR
ncbi:MAG: hypothetical protein ACFCUS_03705 [Rubrimonas sp.]|uniref:hypothetical protein n=1 Tax=Rubrimonas sp. TaxID=2036015 RepID=UPI002FDE04C1